MIKRIYIHNFRCLESFEVKFGSFGVLCGPNGSGKSSVFDALRLIQNLSSGDGQLGATGEDDIENLEFTKWLTSKEQQFELSINVGNHTLDYALSLEQNAHFHEPRIKQEKALCDGETLFERDLEGVHFQSLGGEQKEFPLDWRQSALAAIEPYGGKFENVKLMQEEIANLLILRPNPRSMEHENKSELRHPDLSMLKLNSWYRALAQEQEWTDCLRDSIQEIWPDFQFFKQVDVGMNVKSLQLRFNGNNKEPLLLFLHQLSDGERALLGLYMVRAAMEIGNARTVLIDEPDNFVGLPELQPWMLSMQELLDESHQLLIISHHPEILETLDSKNGSYFWRDNHTAPSRIGPLRIPEKMTAGEAVARGWVDGK